MRIRLLLAPIVLVALVLTACSGSSGGTSSSGGSQKKNSAVVAEKKTDSEVTVALAASSDEVEKLEKQLQDAKREILEERQYSSDLEEIFESMDTCRMVMVTYIAGIDEASTMNFLCDKFLENYGEFAKKHADRGWAQRN